MRPISGHKSRYNSFIFPLALSEVVDTKTASPYGARDSEKRGLTVSDGSIHVVFAEEDTLFRLMEMCLKRKLTPEGEKTLRYFFGSEVGTPLEALTTMADRLDLPADIDTTYAKTNRN